MSTLLTISMCIYFQMESIVDRMQDEYTVDYIHVYLFSDGVYSEQDAG